jgi:N-glycosylase/DNA lyase
VLDGTLDLLALVQMPYVEAKEALMEMKGIGPKIADCIAIFSLEKLEAFPIDVWIRRALAEWYFPNQKTPPDKVMLEWAQGHFGRYGGYAQQYLFHGQRLRKKTD